MVVLPVRSSVTGSRPPFQDLPLVRSVLRQRTSPPVLHPLPPSLVDLYQGSSIRLHYLRSMSSAMEELRSAVRDHVDLVADLVEKLSAELRSGFRPAYENFLGFFHAIDWKEPWLICLLSFHVLLLLITIFSRKNINFQLFLSIMAFSGVFLAEKLNHFLAENWKSFAGQNYFDPHGLFMSVLWSGPLLLISMLIVVNTLFTLVKLIIQWKRAELRHRARLARGKQD